VATNNAFLDCLILRPCGARIDLLLPCAMSNHYIRDLLFASPLHRFIEHFPNSSPDAKCLA